MRRPLSLHQLRHGVAAASARRRARAPSQERQHAGTDILGAGSGLHHRRHRRPGQYRRRGHCPRARRPRSHLLDVGQRHRGHVHQVSRGRAHHHVQGQRRHGRASGWHHAHHRAGPRPPLEAPGPLLRHRRHVRHTMHHERQPADRSLHEHLLHTREHRGQLTARQRGQRPGPAQRPGLQASFSAAPSAVSWPSSSTAASPA